MKRMSKSRGPYKQGTYKPINEGKYTGKHKPRYLSSWELKFFRWCDNNPHVVEWTSESISIPYISPLDGKIHRYLVDNKVIIKEGNKFQKYLIEIKPKRETKPPTKHGNKKKSTILYESATYAKNMAKWEAARKWCKKNGYIFQIVTEVDFKLFTS